MTWLSLIEDFLSPRHERILFFFAEEMAFEPFASVFPLLVSSLLESSLVATVRIGALLESVALESFEFSSVLPGGFLCHSSVGSAGSLVSVEGFF